MELAVQHHQAGRLAQAEGLYRQVLAQDGNYPDAIHLLGVLAMQVGKWTDAVNLIGRAAAMKPDAADYHSNLGIVLEKMGKLDAAIAEWNRTLELQPDHAEAHSNLSMALEAKGDLEAALSHGRKATELKPQYAEAHSNLGIALRSSGRLDDAIIEWKKAVEIRPDHFMSQTNLGIALAERGELDAGLAACRRCVEINPNYALGYLNLGVVLQKRGDLIGAIVAWRKAAILKPDLAMAHANLGLALARKGDLENALAACLRAIELAPNSAEVHFNLAVIHGIRNEAQKAIAECQRAIELRPGYADVHACLGDQYQSIGEMAKAEESYRMALRAKPAHALAREQLATILRGTLPENDLAPMEELLADAKLANESRWHLLFGLAQVFDARGQYPRAAEKLAEAHSLKSAQLRANGLGFDAKEQSGYVQQIIDAFSAEFFARLSGAGSDSIRPVFVFGLPRSGTSLIEQILASHSAIHGAGELRLAGHTFSALPRITGSRQSVVECVKLLDAKSIAQLAKEHLDKLQAIDGGKSARIIDKWTDNYLHLGLLATLFPRATFIHCRRELCDVAVSCWMSDFHNITWADEVENLAARFGHYLRLMSHWRATLPAKIHEVRYENVVTNQESEARRLVDACGLEWEPACLDFHKTTRPIHTAAATQVRQPVHTRSVGRWKNYQKDLAHLFAALPSEG